MGIELVASLVAIGATMLGAVTAIVKISLSIKSSNSEQTLAIAKLTAVIDNLANEVADMKGYGDRISRNETEIKLINQRCDFNHKE